MKILVMTAVEREALALGTLPNTHILVSGIGRTNAAAATALAIERHGPFDAVISAGIAGMLPGSNLAIGDVVAANECIYAEEGVLTPDGFQDVGEMGFTLGDFNGNRVPCDTLLIDAIRPIISIGPIATVATCSGTDQLAGQIAERTGAIAEAMEGAAVVHAARRLGVRAIEIRAISNSTGNRPGQTWNIAAALDALREAVHASIEKLQTVKSE